ncbi:MAG: PHB depolymerase family esterase, partial [Rhodoferax sp.]|nr:PHB depolymerase family esterase [Rhodoferax sp.]
MNETLQELMRTATRLTRSGRLNEATEAIQRALRGTSAGPLPVPGVVTPKASPLVLDDCVFELDARKPAAPDFGIGAFTSGTHTHASLTRRFKLYIPPGHVGRSLPLVVMLHGCTQDPDDFAAGTAMNQRACEQ